MRQRVLIEGFYSINVTKEILRDYLYGVAAHFNLRTYGENQRYLHHKAWVKMKTLVLMHLFH